MNNSPIVIDIVCGGQSGEHEISTISASSIINGLIELPQKYTVYAIYISKAGEWFRTKDAITTKIDNNFLLNLKNTGITVFPSVNPNNKIYFTLNNNFEKLPDIYFPVLHGTKGEDGVIQGLFDLMNIPYVGCGLAAGMSGMDKELMRRLFESHKIPLLPWLSIIKEEFANNSSESIKYIEKKLKYPMFVKPSNLGSSVGITKVNNNSELPNALNVAFKYGNKAVIEEGRIVREIECAVLGNLDLKISVLGEIIPGSDFYDYNDKYFENKSKSQIPANLPVDVVKKIQDFAKIAYNAIQAKGLSRIDFFICKETDQIFINEINTFPGFTNISMYPKLMEASGIPFKSLLETLIKLGFENHRREINN